MATKKKELLEQENPAPETTVPVENTPPPDEAQADMAVPSDGGDLNELLASMDQTDEDAAPTEDGGTLPELTESEMFGAADADTAAADALPGEDDTAALTEGPDSDDGEDKTLMVNITRYCTVTTKNYSNCSCFLQQTFCFILYCLLASTVKSTRLAVVKSS